MFCGFKTQCFRGEVKTQCFGGLKTVFWGLKTVFFGFTGLSKESRYPPGGGGYLAELAEISLCFKKM